MNSFNGTWVDEGGLQISIQQSANILTEVVYENGRGSFQGFEVDLGSPVISVNFSDGKAPDAGTQVGVLNFSKTSIHWSNGTIWNKTKGK